MSQEGHGGLIARVSHLESPTRGIHRSESCHSRPYTTPTQVSFPSFPPLVDEITHPFRVTILSFFARLTSASLTWPVRTMATSASSGQSGARGSSGVMTSNSSRASAMDAGWRRVGCQAIGLGAGWPGEGEREARGVGRLMAVGRGEYTVRWCQAKR